MKIRLKASFAAIALLAVALLVAAGSGLLDPERPVRVRALVIDDKTRQPVPGIVVSAHVNTYGFSMLAGAEERARAATDDIGRVEFRILARGYVWLEVQPCPPGKRGAAEADFSVRDFNARQLDVELTLRPKLSDCPGWNPRGP